MKKSRELFLIGITLCFSICILFRQIPGRGSCLSAADTADTELSAAGVKNAAPAFADSDNEAGCKPLQNTSVILDPGHGGKDPGVVLDTVYEKDVNLQIAGKLQSLLTDWGCNVVMTREDDSYISLEDRVDLTRMQKADLFLSIHLNAVDEDTITSGIESYYNDSDCPGSRQLAEAIQNETVRQTGAKDRGARGDSGLYVVRNAAVPACLMEAGFLTSDTERPLLLSEDYQTAIAEGIAHGILLYLSENDTETALTSSQTEESSTESTPEVSQSDDSNKEVEENWSEYDNKSQGWGQGVNFNSKNQPEGALSYQKKYGSYDAHFIGPDTDDKVIWLTLDEGYENGYTSKILDVLKEKNCQAVFFITGPYAEQNPDLVQRMIDEGHVVGNHSWSHPSKGMPSLSAEDQIADITRLHDYVKEHYDYEMTLFRNPAGIFSERSLAVTRSLGYDSMFWSFAYADWDPAKQPDPQASLQKLVERLHPGALYLLHAVSETNTEILGDFIDEARSQGYEFLLP